MSTVKICTQCGESKPVSDFNANRLGRNGLRSYCKVCQSEYRRAYHEANREREAESNRAWMAANRERRRAYRTANAERQSENQRIWRDANRDKVAQAAARQRARYPDRMAARMAVAHAVEHGRIPPARDLTCGCGAQADHYHHRNGYAPEHKFDVIPVCIACHTELHRDRLPEEGE